MGSARGTIWRNCPVGLPLGPVSEPAHGGSGGSLTHRGSISPRLCFDPSHGHPFFQPPSGPGLSGLLCLLYSPRTLPIHQSLLLTGRYRFIFPHWPCSRGSLGRGDDVLLNAGMLPLFFHGRCVFTCTPFINQHMSELFARKQSNCQHERPWKSDTCDVRAHTHQLFPYRVNVHQQSVPGAGDAAVDQTGSVPSVLAPCSVS